MGSHNERLHPSRVSSLTSVHSLSTKAGRKLESSRHSGSSASAERLANLTMALKFSGVLGIQTKRLRIRSSTLTWYGKAVTWLPVATVGAIAACATISGTTTVLCSTTGSTVLGRATLLSRSGTGVSCSAGVTP